MAMDSWELVTALSEISISTSDSTKETTIYGNGKHQAAVVVRITPTNESRALLSVSWEDVQSHVKFIDHETGTYLKMESPGISGWAWSAFSNGYPGYGPSGYPANQAVFYIMSSQSGVGKSVAVEIKLSNGTVYRTDKSATNGFDQSVLIHAQTPIDYSNAQNWLVDDSESFQTIADNLNYQSYVASDGNWGTWRDNYDAKSRWKRIPIVNIHAKDGVKIIYNDAAFSPPTSVSGKTIGKIFSHFGDREWIEGDYNLYFFSEPRAVSAWNADQQNTFIWFVEPTDKFGIQPNGWLTYAASNHYYRLHFGESDTRHVHTPSPHRSDAISVYLWNLNIPDSGIYQYGWSDQLNDAMVHVTDNFGNEGTLKISFRNNSWKPILG